MAWAVRNGAIIRLIHGDGERPERDGARRVGAGGSMPVVPTTDRVGTTSADYRLDLSSYPVARQRDHAIRGLLGRAGSDAAVRTHRWTSETIAVALAHLSNRPIQVL